MNLELVKQHDSAKRSYKWLEERFEDISKSLKKRRESLKAIRKEVKKLDFEKIEAYASFHQLC